jgi:hypothetical protein
MSSPGTGAGNRMLAGSAHCTYTHIARRRNQSRLYRRDKWVRRGARDWGPGGGRAVPGPLPGSAGAVTGLGQVALGRLSPAIGIPASRHVGRDGQRAGFSGANYRNGIPDGVVAGQWRHEPAMVPAVACN